MRMCRWVMNEPKMYFEDEKESNEILEEWKSRLFLSDWNIKLIEEDKLGEERAGQAEVQWVSSSGIIRMLTQKAIEDVGPVIEKQPQELILIHELLHFKYMSVENVGSIEGVYYEESQHRLLEQMAKSLYMTKYDLNYEWFKI